jgi:SAM-dependent methyltransferase/uncharacterized protein YbaR (Trm112 family)
MNQNVLSKIELICPKCRKIEQGRLTQHPLSLGLVSQKQDDYVLSGFMVCTNPECQQKYPIIDWVPVVLKNFDEWCSVQFEKTQPANNEQDLKIIQTCLNEQTKKQLTQQAQIATYMDNHYGEYTNTKYHFPWEKNPQYWQKIAQLAKPKEKQKAALDLGCCVGRFTFELAKNAEVAVGLDSNFALVKEAAKIQRAHGRLSYTFKYRASGDRKVAGSFQAPDNVLFLVGDALDPPFSMQSFDEISALNLVDSVSVPLILLGQIDALLRSKGSLILGSPFTWKSEITNPAEWLETPEKNAQTFIKETLTGKINPDCGFNYTIDKEIEKLVWSLRNSDTYSSVFLVSLLKAIKR